MPERRWYAIAVDGRLVHDEAWACEGDVVRALHGSIPVGARAPGLLLVRHYPRGLWERVHPGS